MFEWWPEHKRRWFLITFSATAWLLFANAVAALGRQIAAGGIGLDAYHAAGVIGTFAGWAVIWSAFHLKLRHLVAAVMFGVSLNALLVDFGVRDHVAAGIWSAECGAGAGDACHQLADYYAAGKSPMHGLLDAVALRKRACSLGRPTAASCTAAADPRTILEDLEHRERLCFVGHSATPCMSAGSHYEALGRLPEATALYERACEVSRLTETPEGCLELLDSGVPQLRAQACQRIDVVCRTSSDRQCELAELRCERARSPYAGTN